MSKTIKQLADDLKVSKTAVRRYLTNEIREQHTQISANGTIEISETGCKLIAESFRKLQETDQKQEPETTGNQVSVDVVSLLREELVAKNEQIATLQRQNEQLTVALQNTTDSLKAAQALHAGTMQQQQLQAPDMQQVV